MKWFKRFADFYDRIQTGGLSHEEMQAWADMKPLSAPETVIVDALRLSIKGDKTELEKAHMLFKGYTMQGGRLSIQELAKMAGGMLL